MNSKDLRSIAEGLIETFKRAGNESIKIEKQGVKIKTKEDGHLMQLCKCKIHASP